MSKEPPLLDAFHRSNFLKPIISQVVFPSLSVIQPCNVSCPRLLTGPFKRIPLEINTGLRFPGPNGASLSRSSKNFKLTSASEISESMDSSGTTVNESSPWSTASFNCLRNSGIFSSRIVKPQACAWPPKFINRSSHFKTPSNKENDGMERPEPLPIQFLFEITIEGF